MALISETREVHDFDQVVLQGIGDILLTQGDTESLTIEAEPEVMAKLKSEVQDRRLVLGWKSWLDNILSPVSKIRYHISMRTINGVTISGAGTLGAQSIRSDRCELRVSGQGEMAVEQIGAKELAVHISGSGRVTLAGQIDSIDVQVSGSGFLDGKGLNSQQAAVKISGSGNVTLGVRNKLDAHITGAGDVRYVGQPQVTQHISGAGRVEPLGL